MRITGTLIPALRRQSQADFREFKASMVYRVNSRTAKATERPCLKNKKIQNKTKTYESLRNKPREYKIRTATTHTHVPIHTTIQTTVFYRQAFHFFKKTK